MRTWIPLLVLAACGGDSSPQPPDPQPHCKALARAWCERFYDCYTADQIAAVGLPRSVGDCVRELELDMRCEAVVPDTVCPDGYELAKEDADECIADVNDSVCSQLLEPARVAESCQQACGHVIGSCPSVTCDPADETSCGASQACRLDAACGAVCDADIGLGTALDECTDDGDCAAGHTCSTQSGLCTELCDDTHACGEGRECAGAVHAEVGVRECSDGCIPGRDECPSGMTCGLPTLSSTLSMCVAAGTGGQLAPCANDSDCAEGFMCLTDAQGANGRCYEGCDTQNPCSNGSSCYGWSPPAIIRGVTFGYCQ